MDRVISIEEPHWDSFRFFESSVLQDKPLVKDEKPLALFQQKPNSKLENLNIVGCAAGKGLLVFAEQEKRADADVGGWLNIMDKYYNINQQQIFKTKIRAIKWLRDHLIAIGDDKHEIGIVKIFEQENGNKLKEVKKFPLFTETPNCEFTIQAIEAADDMSYTAVAVDSTDKDGSQYCGLVLLFRGDISSSFTRGSKIKVSQPVTSLGFARYSEQGFALFVTTQGNVYRYVIDSKGTSAPDIDKNRGCSLGCGSMSSSGIFALAVNDGLYFYNEKSAKSYLEYAFGDEKIMCQWFNNYLVVVSKNTDSYNRDRQNVTIYDLENQFIAHNFKSDRWNVKYIMSEWGSVFIVVKELDKDNIEKFKIFQLQEKDDQAKLDLLMAKYKFEVARKLAKDSIEAEICKRWGDYLFNKGDYTGAITQYMSTIGTLEPSYVIRKFLNAQKSEFLVKYLLELHIKGRSNADHTALLLKCLTNQSIGRKEAERKLDEFIDEKAKLQYDRKTAIAVLRETGYIEQAIKLARKNGEHHWFIKIYMEDFPNDKTTKNYEIALKYIESLECEEAENYLKMHGKTLLEKLPQQTTNVLIRLCVNYYKTEESVENRVLHAQSNMKFKREHGRKIKTNQQSGRFSSILGLGTTSELSSDVSGSESESEEEESKRTVKHANAEDFIQYFPQTKEGLYWLMVFLENVSERTPKDSNRLLAPEIYNTLFELYLTFWTLTPKDANIPDEKQPYKPPGYAREKEDISVQLYDIYPPNPDLCQMKYDEKCLYLLTKPEANYDSDHVKNLLHTLMVAQAKKFPEAILHLHEKLGLYYDILLYYMEQHDYQKVIESCKRLSRKATVDGDDDPNMWTLVLTYFVKCITPEKSFEQEIFEVIREIEQRDILPPLKLIQILNQNPLAQIKTIQKVLMKKLHIEQELTRKANSKIEAQQEDSQKLSEEIENLRRNAVVFQSTTCTGCGKPLDLPVVHFMCKHSYHQRCVDGGECVKCSERNREAIERQSEFSKEIKEDDFFKIINSNKRKAFEATVEFFGRGIFKKDTLDVNISEQDNEHIDSDEDSDKELDEE